MDELTFDKENRERIQAVENSFGPSGSPLSKMGRVLVGEGQLIKQGRRKPEPKAFFLFNDVLVYGSVILNGRWYKKQKIIPLEAIQLEDMEDGALTNQWLIRTPRKSFFVSAPTYEEKRSWMEHIQDCRARHLQGSGRQPGSNFAVSWIPDRASYKCMRCLNKFTATNRRHHCRKCGFLVCNVCSKQREVIDHIHPKKQQRVCALCHIRSQGGMSRQRESRGRGKNSLEVDELMASSDEEPVTHSHQPSSWLDSRSGTWGPVDYYDYSPARRATS
ncbi:pleckstrin homology domain-containing family F member 1-like [Mastacembelus armatus]|uniref:Pleckstrin homology domain-containing family F member 1-like n=1 Tax=Mastacembelus armatus TaxID=205130 RepID=A0A3Q3LVQ6_9TELE|nr:pleckstrin homology domain-containing family F member 1-like [Mastacembelus armatus]